MRCSGLEYFPYPGKFNIAQRSSVMKTAQMIHYKTMQTSSHREILHSTPAQHQTTTYFVETTPTTHYVLAEKGVFPQNMVLMLISGVIILVLPVIIILAYKMTKRRSNEQNDKSQSANANESHNITTDLEATASMYVNVTNQIQEQVGQYEPVDMRLMRRPNPEVCLYTHLTSNENRDTYLEPINTNRNWTESELNDPYQIID